MSCGNPHGTPCTEVLSAIFLYVDHELSDTQQVHSIEVHLEECPPCHDSYGAQQRLREFVAQCCQQPDAPEDVRSHVMQRLTEIRFQLTLEEPQ